MSFAPIALKIMSEFDWNNILAMIAKKLPQINANCLLEEVSFHKVYRQRH